jgi:hypothetical protein
VLLQPPITISKLIMAPLSVRFHGNLHPKYASFKDGCYTTTCKIVSILGCSTTILVKVTYSAKDINWLNDFWIRDCNTESDVMCILDRWYSFESSLVVIDRGTVKLGEIYVTSLDNDTDIELARKRRSLRLSM